MGYTIFEAEKDGIGAELTFLVPGDENCEIQRVKLTNRSDTVRSFRFTGAVEWCLWNAVDDSTNFQRNLNIGELEVEDSVIYHKTEYRERRDHYAYYGVNAPSAATTPTGTPSWAPSAASPPLRPLSAARPVISWPTAAPPWRHCTWT